MVVAVVRPDRRNEEMNLLVLGVGVMVSRYIVTSLAGHQTARHLAPFLAIAVALLLGAHLAIRWLARGADATVLPLAGLLNGRGHVVVARSDYRLAGLPAARGQAPDADLAHQGPALSQRCSPRDLAPQSSHS